MEQYRDHVEETVAKPEKHADKHTRQLLMLHKSQPVRVVKDNHQWQPAKVTSQKGQRSYQIVTHEGVQFV